MSSTTSSSASGPIVGLGGGPRVAIPRLQRPLSSTTGRRRVARACNACRIHKIKCSGDSSPCKNCESSGRACNYVTARKDRLKIVTDRCAQMVGYLRALSPLASEEDVVKIRKLLERVEVDIADKSQTHTSYTSECDGEDSRESDPLMPDSPADSQHIDVEPEDHLDEDLHQSDRSRATGYVGKNSEVQWLRTLLQPHWPDDECMLGQQGSFQTSANGDQVSQVTFYLDANNVELDYVDEYQLPTLATAKHLLAVYMEKVHDSFPILSMKVFQIQVVRYFQAVDAGRTARLAPKWRAILNLVFAIGARYSNLYDPNWAHDKDRFDHTVYQARARKVGWNNATLSQHPDLPQIQVGGLLGFYFLSTGQVSRAWVVSGMALRFAQALGLHVRNEDPTTSLLKREKHVRIWWSLYSLDRQLSVITGRLGGVVDSTCSTLQGPVPEEKTMGKMGGTSGTSSPGSSSAVSTISGSKDTGPHPMRGIVAPHESTGLEKHEFHSGFYFQAVIQLTRISQAIHSSLYSAGALRSQAELQQASSRLGQQLDKWLASLPDELDFQKHRVPGVYNPSYRRGILLGFQFYSARILLTRPSLGRMGRFSGEEESSTASPDFLRAMALLCIDAAKAELDLLPDRPDAQFVCKYAPWWSCVHYLMQAVASLLLALSSPMFPMHDLAVLASYAKKAIRWLRSMYDVLAYRAYLVAMSAYQAVANKLSLDMTDLWNEHVMAYHDIDPTFEGGAGVSQMDFSTFFADTSPMVSFGLHDSNIAVPLQQPAAPPFVSCEPVAANFGLPFQPSEALYDEAFYRSG